MGEEGGISLGGWGWAKVVEVGRRECKDTEMTGMGAGKGLWWRTDGETKKNENTLKIFT